jgi:TatD DNase family protein
MPNYIDIHSHINLNAFKGDYKEVIERAHDSDTWVINVGTQIDTSRRAVEIANEYEEGVYAIVGLHPVHTSASYHDEQEFSTAGDPPVSGFTSRGEVFDKDAYRELLKNPKVVGIGECGLDYYRCTDETIAKQKQAFIAQIELANEFNKPLMLHIRNNKQDAEHNAYVDAIELLKQYAQVKGDVHFFAGTVEEAQMYLDFGFTLSFTGVLTFTHDYNEVIRITPLDMLMAETDAPYVAPVPHRGKRNEPVYVSEVAKKIAQIKGLGEEEVAKALVLNAKRVFDI